MADQQPTDPQPVDEDSLVTVGVIKGPWGRTGAVRVRAVTSDPDRFSPGAELLLEGAPTRVRHVHWSRGDAILVLEGVAARDAAEDLRGRELQVMASSLPELEEGEYYHFQLMDLEVWTAQGERLGVVADILVTGSNDVLVVRDGAAEVLVPAIEDVVREVDLTGGRLTVDLPEGLR